MVELADPLDPTATMVTDETGGPWTQKKPNAFFTRANVAQTRLIGSASRRLLGRNAFCKPHSRRVRDHLATWVTYSPVDG